MESKLRKTIQKRKSQKNSFHKLLLPANLPSNISKLRTVRNKV